MEGGMVATRLGGSGGRNSSNENCEFGEADNGHDDLDDVNEEEMTLNERERDFMKWRLSFYRLRPGTLTGKLDADFG
jgi:hypothetical protein